MPFANRRRKIEPVRPKRGLPPNMKVPDDLEAHANMTMAHLILQMNSLSHQAEEIFTTLLKDAKEVSTRSSILQTRMHHLANKINKSTVFRGESSIYECVNILCPWEKASAESQPILNKENISQDYSKLYKYSDSIPAFNEFNQFMPGNQDYNKLFSDPNYFNENWKLSNALAEIKSNEKKAQHPPLGVHNGQTDPLPMSYSQSIDDDNDSFGWDSFDDEETLEDTDCSIDGESRKVGRLRITRRQAMRPRAAPPPPPPRSLTDEKPAYSGAPIPPPLPPHPLTGASIPKKLHVSVSVQISEEPSTVPTERPTLGPPPPPLPLDLCTPSHQNPPDDTNTSTLHNLTSRNSASQATKSESSATTPVAGPPPPPPLPLYLLPPGLAPPQTSPLTLNKISLPTPQLKPASSSPSELCGPPLPTPLPLDLLLREVKLRSSKLLPSPPLLNPENSENPEPQPESSVALTPFLPLTPPHSCPESLDFVTANPLTESQRVDTQTSLQPYSNIAQDSPLVCEELLEKLRARRQWES